MALGKELLHCCPFVVWNFVIRYVALFSCAVVKAVALDVGTLRTFELSHSKWADPE